MENWYTRRRNFLKDIWDTLKKKSFETLCYNNSPHHRRWEQNCPFLRFSFSFYVFFQCLNVLPEVLGVCDFLMAVMLLRLTTEELSAESRTALGGRAVRGDKGFLVVPGLCRDGTWTWCAGRGCNLELCGLTFSLNDINFLTASGSSAPGIRRFDKWYSNHNILWGDEKSLSIPCQSHLQL